MSFPSPASVPTSPPDADNIDLPDDPAPVPELDTPPQHANAVLSLSTFQPGPTDPTDGYWDAFPKFGKLGPELASRTGDHRKNTLILFKPGACFRTDPQRPLMGHAITMRQLLPQHAADSLAQQGINLIHPAFALIVPVTLPKELSHHA